MDHFHSRYKYSSLPELVEACKRNEARGLACLLTEECIKPRSKNIIGDSGGKWDIPRSELTMDKELGRGNFGIVIRGRFDSYLNFTFHKQCNFTVKYKYAFISNYWK